MSPYSPKNSRPTRHEWARSILLANDGWRKVTAARAVAPGREEATMARPAQLVSPFHVTGDSRA